MKSPKLSLTDNERKALRVNKILLKDIHTLSVAKLASVLQGTIEGATEIRGLAIFQAIPSIGPQTAKNMLDRATFL